MPFKSEKQRKFMFAQHPEIAKKFEAEGKAYVESSPKVSAMKRMLSKKDKK